MTKAAPSHVGEEPTLRCRVDPRFAEAVRALGLDRRDRFETALAHATRVPGGRSHNYLIAMPQEYGTDRPARRLRLRPLLHGGVLGPLLGGRHASPRRCEREFESWRELEARGAPLPPVVLAVSVRRGRLWSCAIGSVEIEPSSTALDRLRDDRQPAPRLDRMVEAIAEAIRRFHDAGGVHGDLHLANILIAEQDADATHDAGSTIRCWLVDLAHARVLPRVEATDRVRDLARLWRSIEKRGVARPIDSRTRARFLSTYCAGDRGLRRAMRRHMARESRRLLRHRIGWRLAGRPASALRSLAMLGCLLLFGLGCSDSEAALTSAPRETPRLSLLATGDTGRSRPFAAIVEGQLAVAHAMTEEDEAAPVDGLILLGDNFYYHGLAREHLVERIATNLVGPYCRFVELDGPRSHEVAEHCSREASARNPVPIYAVLGNHDLESAESARLQREAVPLFVPEWKMSPTLAEVFELGEGVSLILFESEVSIDDPASIDAALVGAISRARGPWRILATHRPIATDDLGGLPIGGYPIWVRDAIARAGRPVQLVLAGHHHNLQAFALEDPTRLLQIGVGSGSRATPPLAKDEVPSLYGSIELGFVRVDLVGRDAAERLAVSLHGTPRWPILSPFFDHVERAVFEVDRDGIVRNLRATTPRTIVPR